MAAKRKLAASGELPPAAVGKVSINEILEEKRVAFTEPDGRETFEG